MTFQGVIQGIDRTLKLRLYETGSVRNRWEIDRDKPCLYTGPGRSALDQLSYHVPNVFTCESDPVWNRIILGCYQAHVNTSQAKLHQSGSYPNGTVAHKCHGKTFLFTANFKFWGQNFLIHAKL